MLPHAKCVMTSRYHGPLPLAARVARARVEPPSWFGTRARANTTVGSPRLQGGGDGGSAATPTNCLDDGSGVARKDLASRAPLRQATVLVERLFGRDKACEIGAQMLVPYP